MPTFRYLSRDNSGQSIRGVMSASSPSEVANRLRNINQTPVSIHRIYSFQFERWLKKSKRVRPMDFIMYNRQFATLLLAGLPIISAIETLSEQTHEKTLKELSLSVANSIKAGNTLADSLRQHLHVFSDSHINMIRSAEESGRLPEVLNRIAEMAEYDFVTRTKIKSAVRYPLMVVVAIVIAFIILMAFVLPQFVKLFTSLGIELPLPTRVLIAINSIVQKYGLSLLMVVIVSVVLLRIWLFIPSGRLRWDKFKLRLPLFGEIILMMVVSRFCRTFGMLLQSGVPILRIFGLLKDTVNNRAFSELLEKAGQAVERGETISSGFENSDMAPPLLIQMLGVGEKTGRLDEMLFKIADHYEMEFDYKTKTLTTVLEPILLVFIGGSIAFLALAIFLPMWDMAKLARLR